LERSKPIGKAKIVYADNGNIYREEIEIPPYGHEETPYGKWEILVADGTIEIEGEAVRWRTSNSSLILWFPPLFVMKTSIGALLDVHRVGKQKKRLKKNTSYPCSVYTCCLKAIKKGEIAGILKVLNTILLVGVRES